MATCKKTLESIIENGLFEDITVCTPNTLMPIQISNVNKQLFRLEISKQETASFIISLVSDVPPNNVGVVINFYQLINESVILSLGSVIISEMILNFQKDFTPGTYLICMSSTTFSYTGTFFGQFTSYPIAARFKFLNYSSENLSDFEFYIDNAPKPCDELLYFEILDGSLPPGLILTLPGNIIGVLPNLDCIKENEKLSPSQNWYYDLDETWFPWGRQWRFLVKVWLFNFPEATDEKWFCIRVHNNWSVDRDDFISHIPWEIEIQDTPLIKKAFELPETVECCDPLENENLPRREVTLSPSLKTEYELCPCDSESIDEAMINLDFLKWYQDIIENPPDDDNPFIRDFVNKFKKSEYYIKLLNNYHIDNDNLTFLEREKKIFAEIIDGYEKSLINGRRENDIDTLMGESQDNENQKLPITCLTMSGSLLEITLGK